MSVPQPVTRDSARLRTADCDLGELVRIVAQRTHLADFSLAADVQLARTPGGGTVFWVGRRKQAGQGEGSSGLKFDTALPPGGL